MLGKACFWILVAADGQNGDGSSLKCAFGFTSARRMDAYRQHFAQQLNVIEMNAVNKDDVAAELMGAGARFVRFNPEDDGSGGQVYSVADVVRSLHQ